MQTMAGHNLVCAGDDGNTGAMQGAYRAQKDLENRICTRHGSSGHSGIVDCPREFPWEFGCSGFDVYKWCIRRMQRPLEDNHCRINYGAMCLQELQGMLGLRSLKINWWLWLTGLRTKILWQHYWRDVLDVIDLVHPSIDPLDGIHAVGNVASD